VLNPDVPVDRPVTREDCVQGTNAVRPCPFVSCKHHLALDVSPETGAIKLNFPHLEVWEMDETCALDVADRGGVTLEEVGAAMNVTRERARQIETRALDALRASPELEVIRPDAGVSRPQQTEHARFDSGGAILYPLRARLPALAAAVRQREAARSGVGAPAVAAAIRRAPPPRQLGDLEPLLLPQTMPLRDALRDVDALHDSDDSIETWLAR
jgi:hypothetical protein